MITKRLRTIDLDAVLLEEEEASEDKDPNHKKSHVRFDHGFIIRKKKAFSTVFLFC